MFISRADRFVQYGVQMIEYTNGNKIKSVSPDDYFCPNSTITWMHF